MTTATRAPASPPAAAPPRVVDGLYRLSLAQYDRMVADGILSEHDRIYLLHGLLVPKMTQAPDHAFAFLTIHLALTRMLPDGWHLRPQLPIGLSNGPKGCASAPEPDLAVAIGEPEDYRGHHPRGTDLGLVVEVANTSLKKDHELLACYAFAGISTVWIVDLKRRVVEVHEDPTGPAAGDQARYLTSSEITEGEGLRVILRGVEVGRIAVAEVLPAAEADGPEREDV